MDEKRLAGESAALLVRDGMVVGLGTGSTVAWTIRAIGRMVAEGLDILAVPTSYQSEALAIECGIPLTTLSQNPVLDLAIDGVDQIDIRMNAIKGGGAAHTREKVVSIAARRFVVVADGSKRVEVLNRPVPVEVLPFAAMVVERELVRIGGYPVVRQARMKDGPVITDNGNFVMDVSFGEIRDPATLAQEISQIPGVVDHGIFTKIDELHIAHNGTVEVIRRNDL
ncbi:MAG: ribose-5-phosphate isomerase RpiA [Methanothrix sp.]|uniref:ribose-5-phosphate isomerase RpiA n=1 Tax=Methanothrix sp. TaxID=90426 RepID=UPI0015851C11|nr:ribose-5-phosphate isomerase RpiA [Methanothrix thermoacetophila]MBC7079744.1 ribose-5-phosphate isomerase RpiA [Methanothrix sp.]NPU87819.1 ribose-5-phosphate isomerase RpiA [Methanothrix sp.]